MNSLSLLDSFLSRSLSNTRPPSPPDSSDASIASRNARRRRQHPTTPAEAETVRNGAQTDELGARDVRASSSDLTDIVSLSSSRLTRRNSDFVLQIDRNRLKRSNHLSLGFGMTAARTAESTGSQVGDRRAQSSSSSQVGGGGKDAGASDDHKRYSILGESRTRGHPESASKGQADVHRAHLRRSDSTPASHSASHGAFRWSSSLWGFGSWLDPVLSPGVIATNSKARRRSSRRRSSQQWNYPPGDDVASHDGLEEESKNRSYCKRNRRSGAKVCGEILENSDTSITVATVSGAETFSDDTDSSSGSSTAASDDEAGDSSFNSPPHAELSGRLLFANRIFTPLNHPSLTASVPNLPSEVGLASVGMGGLGGMEDVDTVDFEGEESEIEEDIVNRIALTGSAKHVVTPPATPASPTKSTTPSVGDQRLRRNATATPLTTLRGSKRSHRTQDDYFGPRAVEKELSRKMQSNLGLYRDITQQATEENPKRDACGVSAELRSVAGGDTARESAQSNTFEDHAPPEDPPSYQASTNAGNTSAQSLESTDSEALLPPPKLFPQHRSSAAEVAQEAAEVTSYSAPKPPAFWRRLLSFFRRALIALVFAPFDTITLVIESGTGQRLRKADTRTDSSSASPPTASFTCKQSAKPPSSLTFSDAKKTALQDLRTSERKRPPTPKPEKPAAQQRVDDSDVETVTEDQARERAQRQAVKAKEEAEKQSHTKSEREDAGALTPTHTSRLLPNPHPVNSMLVHEPKAKKVTRELPEEFRKRRERGFSLQEQRSDVMVIVDKVKEEDTAKREGTEAVASEKPRSAAISSPTPRSAVIHHTPKILVLDLDETLIHSTSRSPTWTALRAQHNSRTEAARNAVSTGGSLLGLEGLGGFLGLSGSSKGRSVRPHMVEVVLDGRSVIYHVYKRPWVDYFLRKVAAWYHVVIFTASVQEYADPVIDWLDQGRGLIAGRLFRDACTYRNGSYLKNLAIVDQDLSRVCLVDNSPASYHLNPSNGIPVEGWTHDPSDEALLDLLPILDSLRFAQDVRHVLGIRLPEASQHL